MDDEKAAEETATEDATITDTMLTEDELKLFQDKFRSIVSARVLNRMNDYQAQKSYREYLGYITEEIRKFGNPVIFGLFDLQADIYKAKHMPPSKK